MSDPLEILNLSARWHARDVRYLFGKWDRLRLELPSFKIDDFRAMNDAPCNPYLKTVVRMPRTQFEHPIPVGVVSNSYTLAQHLEVAERCFEGIDSQGIETSELKCELGLTELGEWMNLRIHFPDEWSYSPGDGHKIGLRLECFNSVDRSSSLVVLLGWIRFICSNGLVIGETKAELKDIHNDRMDLSRIRDIVSEGLLCVKADKRRLKGWEQVKVGTDAIGSWANTSVSDRWGKKAACRIFHICMSGCDAEITDQFAGGLATTKPVTLMAEVPGAAKPAQTLYDVSQALSWVATHRTNPEERLEWQSQIPRLVESLRSALKSTPHSTSEI